MHGRALRSLWRDRRGTTALEMTVVVPILLISIIGTLGINDLIASRRALDFGIERALRYAAVQSAVATVATVTSAFRTAAGSISNSVSVNSTVTVVSATFKPGDTVKVSVTYAWTSPLNWVAAAGTGMFSALTLSGSGSIRVMN